MNQPQLSGDGLVGNITAFQVQIYVTMRNGGRYVTRTPGKYLGDASLSCDGGDHLFESDVFFFGHQPPAHFAGSSESRKSGHNSGCCVLAFPFHQTFGVSPIFLCSVPHFLAAAAALPMRIVCHGLGRHFNFAMTLTVCHTRAVVWSSRNATTGETQGSETRRFP